MAKLAKSEAGAKRVTSRVAPLYHELYVHLRRLLVEGHLDPTQALPSEPSLVARFGLSRVTVRRTLGQLQAEGLIRRVQGLGTFPAHRPTRADASGRANIPGLLDNLISYEQDTTATDLEWTEVEPEGDVADVLGTGRLLRIVRVRRYRDQPISLTTIHVPARYFNLLERDGIGDEPVIRALDRAGVRAERAEQVVTAVAASELAARELGVVPGSPLICMRRAMLDAEGAPVLHQESLYAPDRFEYRMTLSRTSVGPVARWSPLA